MSAAAHQNEKSITEPASDKGFMYGVATLIPSSAAVMALTKRSPGFAQSVPVPVRFGLVALPALYVSHLVNGRTQQAHMAERINMLKRDTIRRSELPTADVQDEIKQMYLRDKEKEEIEHADIVPELNLQHRLSNTVSKKPRYVAESDVQRRDTDNNKNRESMMKKLKDHKDSFDGIRDNKAKA